MIPDFEAYEWSHNQTLDLSKTSEINKLNISMAIQLAGHWLLNHKEILKVPLKFAANNDGIIYSVDDKFVEAIKTSDCSGRFHKIDKNGVR